MHDPALVRDILIQISQALETVESRTASIRSPEDFTQSPEGIERLDGLCMLFIAIGEALKSIDRMTEGELLSRYPEIDWKGAKGFRDIVAHHYFDIDPEQVFWICTHRAPPLAQTITKMLSDLE